MVCRDVCVFLVCVYVLMYMWFYARHHVYSWLSIGPPTLLIGTVTGKIFVRSCVTKKVLICLDVNITGKKGHSPDQPVWSVVKVGTNCFASGDQEGQMVCWQIHEGLYD